MSGKTAGMIDTSMKPANHCRYWSMFSWGLSVLFCTNRRAFHPCIRHPL